MTEQVWGDEVDDSGYAGHPGRIYRDRPHSLISLVGDAARFGDRDYLVQGDTRVSFVDLVRAVGHGARVLRAAGAQSGDRVMISAYNSPGWVVALWSTWAAGAVPVLANRWWSRQELEDALSLTEPAIVVTDAADAEVITSAPTVEMSEFSRCIEDPSGSGAVSFPSPDEDAEGLLLFTSGSSGQAKAVRLSHRSLLANQHNLLLRSKRLPHQQEGKDPTVNLVTVPIFHIGGVSSIVTQLIAGGRIVFLRGRFNPAEVLSLIQQEGITSWGGVPTMARRVIEHPDLESYDLSSLRSFPLGGAPIPEMLLERLRSRVPHLSRGLATTWGLTESGGFLTLAGSKDLIERPGTSGKPYPVVEVEVRNPDETGAGELVVRSPTVMMGYVGSDDGTVDSDGWLHTGDIGRVEDGHVFITGRAKDMVIRGGENIACAHVEAAILTHPDVIEVAVFGVPHDDLGEELVATVVTAPGRTTSTLALSEHAGGSLSYFEIPTRWQLRTEPLPVLPTGKVDKRGLREAFLQEALC